MAENKYYKKKEKEQDFMGFQVPVNVDNEGVIISNAISDKDLRGVILKKIDYSQFRSKEFQTIFWSIAEIEKEKLDMTADTILVKANYCPVRTHLDFEIINSVVKNYPIVSEETLTKVHVPQLVTDYTKAKVLDTTVTNLVKTCMDPSTSIGDVQDTANYLVKTIESGRSSAVCEFMSMQELVPQFLAEKNNNKSFRTTGFKQLDMNLTDGLKEKTITIVCGLSGMGKSSFVLSMIKNLSHKSQPTGLYALEMNNMAVISKLLAYNSGLEVRSIVKALNKMTDIEKETFLYETERLSRNKSIFITDKPQTLKNIEQQTLLLQDLLKTEYIPTFIDLFGKIRDLRGSENFARDYENQLNEVQDMAKRLNVPIILVAQINRAVMQRKDKRPTMQDLKNAGAFEEVADLILGVHRPNYDPAVAIKNELLYNTHQHREPSDDEEDEFDVHHNSAAVGDPSQNIAEVITMKQRNGTSNTITNFYFNPKNTCYEPISAEHQYLINQAKDSGEGSF